MPPTPAREPNKARAPHFRRSPFCPGRLARQRRQGPARPRQIESARGGLEPSPARPSPLLCFCALIRTPPRLTPLADPIQRSSFECRSCTYPSAA